MVLRMAGAALTFCSHGLVQRTKLGTDVDARGLETCRGCGLPTMESAIAVGGVPIRRADDVILTTLQAVPGRAIAEVIGLVHGTGHPAMAPLSTTADRGARAIDEARDELREAASRMHADAVVGIVMSSYSGGARSVNQAVGVNLLGTAVRLSSSGGEAGGDRTGSSHQD